MKCLEEIGKSQSRHTGIETVAEAIYRDAHQCTVNFQKWPHMSVI